MVPLHPGVQGRLSWPPPSGWSSSQRATSPSSSSAPRVRGASMPPRPISSSCGHSRAWRAPTPAGAAASPAVVRRRCLSWQAERRRRRRRGGRRSQDGGVSLSLFGWCSCMDEREQQQAAADERGGVGICGVVVAPLLMVAFAGGDGGCAGAVLRRGPGALPCIFLMTAMASHHARQLPPPLSTDCRSSSIIRIAVARSFKVHQIILLLSFRWFPWCSSSSSLKLQKPPFFMSKSMKLLKKKS